MTVTADLPPAGAAPGTARTGALLVCGAVAGPLFTVAWAWLTLLAVHLLRRRSQRPGRRQRRLGVETR
jgi:hypothetical protein